MNEFRTASMRRLVALALGGLGASVLVPMALGACASSTQPSKTPAEHASFMESTRCGPDDNDKALAAVLGGSAVVGVQPLYGAAASKGGQQAALRGASLTVSALPGMTPEWLDRALECYSAKSTLGGATSPEDPFFLPDANVDIDVRPAKDGFDVAVTAFYPADAQRILERANAFKAKTAAPSK